MRRAVTMGFLAAVLLFAGASPAAAKAILQATDPAPGEVLQTPPASLALRFDEPVIAPAGSIVCYDVNGTAYGTSTPTLDGLIVRAQPTFFLGGGYTCTWRFTTARDDQVVSGFWNFGLGTPPDNPTLNTIARAQLAKTERATPKPESSSTAGSVGRTLEGVALAAVVGIAFVVARIAPAWRRSRRLALGSGIALVGALAGALTVLAADGAHPALVLQLAAISAAAGLGWYFFTADAVARWWYIAAPLAALAALTGFAAGGHAGHGSMAWGTVIMGTVHGAAISVWSGGLLAFALIEPATLHDSADQPADDALAPWTHFTTDALAAVGIAVLSGLFLAGAAIGSISALTASEYGRTLLAKTAFFGVAAGMLAAARAQRVSMRVALITQCACLAMVFTCSGMLASQLPPQLR